MQKIKGGDNLSDFKITMRTELDDSKAREQINKLMSDANKNPVKLTADASGLETSVKGILSALKEIQNASKNLNIGGKTNTSNISSTITQFKSLTNQYNALQKQLATETNPKSMSVLKTQIDTVGKSLSTVRTQITQFGSDAEKTMMNSFSTTSSQKLEASFTKTFSSISSKAKTLGTQIQSAFNNPNINTNQLNILQTRYQRIQDIIKNFDMSKMSGESLNSLSTKLSKVDNVLKNLKTTADNTKLENKFNIDCTKSINQLEQLRSKYKSLGKDTTEIDGLINKVKELQSSVGSSNMGNLQNQLNNVNKQASALKSSLGGLSTSVKSTFSQIKSSFMMFTPGYLIGTSLVSGIRSIKEEILELDKSMTNLIKVADDSDVNSSKKIQGITDNAVNIAKEVAGSVSGVVDSMAEAVKAGIEGTEAAAEVAKYAQIFANVGDMEIGTSTKGIATLINAFDIDPLKEFQIEVNGTVQKTTELANAMDVLDWSGNNYAISVGGVLEAMQSGGATLSAYGLSIQESTALITAANESLQNPTKVGNGLKTLAINLAGVKTKATDGTIQLNKTANSLKEIAGIDVFTDKSQNKIKSMTTVLDEVSAKWGDLTDKQQKALAEAMGGKQQSAVINSLLKNYDTYKQMMGEYFNGDQFNAAVIENEKYIDSINGRLASLKATWTGIANTVFNSSMLKSGVSGLDSFSQSINNIIATIDKLNIGIPVAIASIVSLKFAFSSFKYAESFSAGLSLIGMRLASIPQNIAGIPAALSAFTGLNVTMLGLAGTIGIVVAAFVGLKTIQKAVDENNTKYTKNWEELSKSISKTKKELSKNETNESNLSGILNKYEELSQKTNKTKKEQEEYNEALKELAKIDPNLVIYDDNGSPIKARVGEVEDLIRQYQKAQREQKKLLADQLKEQSDNSRGKYQEQASDRNKQGLELEQKKNELTKGAYSTVTGEYAKLLQDNWLEKLLAKDENTIKNADKYFSGLREYKEEEKKFIDTIVSQRDSVNKDSSAYLENLFGRNADLENAGKKRKKAIENVLKLDFSQFDSDEMEKVGTSLNSWLENADYKTKIPDFNDYISQVNQLNSAWESGEITALSYKDGVNAIAEYMSTLTDGEISTEEFAKMLKLPEFDVKSEYELLNDLENANDKVQESIANMAKTSSTKERLQMAFELVQDPTVPIQVRDKISELAADGNVSDQDLEIIMNLMGEMKTEDLENGINTEIDKLSEEKEITKEISIKYAKQVDGGSDFNQYLEEITGSVDLAIDIQTHLATSDIEQLKNDLDGLSENKKIGITVAAINSGSYEPKELQLLLDTFPTDIQTEILTSVAETGVISPEDLKSLLKEFPKEVQTKIRTILEENKVDEVAQSISDLPAIKTILIGVETNDRDKIQSFAESLDSLQASKEIKLAVVRDVANGDLSSLLEDIKDLPPEVQMSIMTNASTAIGELSEADKFTFAEKMIAISVAMGDLEGALQQIQALPNDKQIQVVTNLINSGTMTPEQIEQLINGLPSEVQKNITVSTPGANESKENLDEVNSKSGDKTKKVNTSAPGADKTISQEKQVDANSGNKTKTVLTTNPGGASTLSTINSINSNAKDKKFTITTVFKTIGNAISNAWNSITGSGGSGLKSVGEFSNVSDTPTEASDISAQSSTFSTVSSTPTEASSGVASAKASYAPIDFVSTSKTQATKISTSYKNVWNTIKYGINLFTELENRIKRTQNNLDLLSSKMENAVGTKKIKYLKQQNELYKEQAKLQNTLYKSLVNEKRQLSKKVESQGFNVNSQGNISNYEEQMLKLEKAAADAEKKASSYSGKNEKTKASLEKKADSAKTALENAKKATEEYLQLQYEDIPAAKEAWQDLQNAIKETNDEIEQLNFENKIYKEQHAIDELSVALERASTLADRYATMADRYDGAKKIKYLKLESDKIKEQIELNEKLEKQLSSQRYDYRGQLSKYGVKFDSNKNISNYDDVLNKYQNSQDYDKIKSWMEEYVDLTEAQRDAVNNTEDLKNAQIDLDNEIKKAELDSKISSFSIKISQASQNVKKLTNEIDLLSVKMQHAVGKDKLDLINQQIEKWEQLAKEQQNALDSMKSQEKTYQSELSKYNFNFDDSGNITNKDAMIAKYKDDDSYEYILDTIEKWEQLYNEDIPNATQSIEEYRNSVKDAYQSQLDITKEIEDKITSLYKKQIEDRKNAIQKETDAIVKNLNDQKKAYMDMRKEIDYKNDYTEKTDNISDLERQLEIAKKDTSLSNKKKIADLEKQLADAQKDLDKFVQDKIDSDIESSYDDAIDSAEEKGNAMIEALEELWSDSKIAEMISESLKTGLFTGIDGEVSNLQDALLGYAEDAGEVFGVTGAIIKNELVGNLDIALSTMKDLANIMNGLEVPNFDTSSSLGNISSNNITTGNISVNVTAETNSNPEDIANEVRKAIEEALKGTVQGI